MRKFLYAACCCAALLFANPAEAGVLSSFLSFDGQTDTLVDESVGRIFDRDNSGSISVGDHVLGFLSIRQTSAEGNLDANEQLNSFFAFEVATSANILGPGGLVQQTVRPIDPAAGTGNSLAERLGDPTIDSDAVAAIYSSDSQVGDFINDDFTTAFNFVTSGQLDGFLAFKAPQDFLDIETQNIDADGDGEIDFSELPAASASGTPFAAEAGGFTYIPATTVLPGFIPSVAVSTITGLQTLHEFTLSGQLLGPSLTTDGDFQMTDKTTLAVNAVPEPASLAIFAALGCSGLAMQRRRRKALTA